MLLGSHMPTGGGVHHAFECGMSVGCTTMQVFVKNNTRWRAAPLTDTDVANYKTAEGNATIAPVVAHASYLINLCAVNPSTLKNSRMAFVDELLRCERLGIVALIFHPGAHMGAGEQDGINAIADSLNEVHHQTPGLRVLSTLEVTAGQGSAIGYRFEHLRAIIDRVQEQQRMGVCIDTCHLFASGYNIGTESGWHETIQEFDDVIGLDRLAAIHVNDSKRELGSRVDRHDHIGMGKIGLTAFRMLMNDPRMSHIPKILETEKSVDMHEDVENMRLLRTLANQPESA